MEMFQAVQDTLNMNKIPKTDSIEELAKFWDTHDLTEFEDEMEEVQEPISDKGPPIRHADSPCDPTGESSGTPSR
jgi:hypothetical protein